MSQAQINEASIRVKRWLEAAQNAGLVKGGGKPEVFTSRLWPIATRWRIYETMKWTLDGTADGPIVETEACVAAAQSAPELLHKYALWAQDENRQAYFKDKQLRGEALTQPPLDPPEWAARRRALAEAADMASQNTSEWVRRAARARMEFIGLNDPVKFELAWQKAKAIGAVKD